MKAYKTVSNRCVTYAAVGALSLSMSSIAEAGGNGTGKGGTALIGYDIVNDHCDVEFSSTKDLSNIVIEYADGSPIKYDDLSGYEYIIPGAVLEEATAVYVKSGNNGQRGRKNRGYGQPMTQTFFDKVEECFTPAINWGTCPCVGTERFTRRPWSFFLGGANPQEPRQNTSITPSSQSDFSTINYIENTILNSQIAILSASAISSPDVFCKYKRLDDGGVTNEAQFYVVEDLAIAIQDCRNGLYDLYGED